MTKEEYQILAGRQFILPSGDYGQALLEGLDDLGAEDPVLRDDLAFSAFWTWILQGRVAPAVLAELLPILCSGRYLFSSIGSKDEGLAVRRSFSALLLSTILEYDNKASFLSPADLASVLRSIIEYQDQEVCEVGFSTQVGWVHAFAHSADVMRELMKSGKLQEVQRNSIPDVIVRVLLRVQGVLSYGEDERYCQAMFSSLKNDPDMLTRHVAQVADILTTTKDLSLASARNMTQYLKTCAVYATLAKRDELLQICVPALDRVLPARWKP